MYGRFCVMGCRLICGSHHTCWWVRFKVVACILELSSISPTLIAIMTTRLVYRNVPTWSVRAVSQHQYTRSTTSSAYPTTWIGNMFPQHVDSTHTVVQENILLMFDALLDKLCCQWSSENYMSAKGSQLLFITTNWKSSFRFVMQL